MSIDWKTVTSVVVGMLVFTLLAKFVLSKIPGFSYEDDGAS